MELVEQHVIDRHDPRFEVIDPVCFASKNLYNAALYELRQAFFADKSAPGYAKLAHAMKANVDYKAMPAKVAQWVLRQVCSDWANFWKAHEAYQQNPAKFTGRPKLPHYKDKQKGRNVLVYTAQAISRVALAEGKIAPSNLPIVVTTKQTEVQQVRIVPKASHYVVEVIYKVKPTPRCANRLNSQWAAGVDLGVDVLAAVTTNKRGVSPLLVNGRPLKSVNAFYNKQRARLHAALPKGKYSSRQLVAITDRRNRRIQHFMHTASRRIIDWLVAERIGTLVIGQNKGWKHEVEMGTRNNQNFVAIPHSTFIHMLAYKAKLVGIHVILKSESYTSKCSFLDLEPIGKHAQYAGQRVRRAQFVASDGRMIHADVNGSYNILRQGLPSAFARGIRGVVVRPVRLTPPKLANGHCPKWL